jgi:hypothetical protein
MIFEAWTLWEYEFGAATPLYGIIDGQRRSYGAASFIQNQTVNGKYVSQVGGNMAYADFQQIVQGKSVELRLGKTEFTLSEKARDRLQQFAGMIAP